MRALIWSLRLLLFLVFFAFAAKNTEPVTLRFFFGASWQAPLVVVLFASFAVGGVLGAFALAPTLVHHWRERRRLTAAKERATPGVDA